MANVIFNNYRFYSHCLYDITETDVCRNFEAKENYAHACFDRFRYNVPRIRHKFERKCDFVRSSIK